MFRLVFLFLLLMLQSAHVSFTGVECFPDKGEINLFLKLPYNDFIFDYRYTIDDDQNFDPSGSIDTTKVLVSCYLNNQIQIFADNMKLKGYLTSLSYSDGELKLNVRYYFSNKTRQFKVRNTIHNGAVKIQDNMLIFKYKDLEEGVKLTSDNPEKLFHVK